MARTAEGKRLTAEHKRAQVRLAGLAAALTLENAKRLDPEDLDGTEGRWMAAQVAIITTLRVEAERLAEEYLSAFWAAEGMKPRTVVRTELPPAVDSVSWVVPTIKARMRDAAS